MKHRLVSTVLVSAEKGQSWVGRFCLSRFREVAHFLFRKDATAPTLLGVTSKGIAHRVLLEEGNSPTLTMDSFTWDKPPFKTLSYPLSSHRHTGASSPCMTGTR